MQLKYLAAVLATAGIASVGQAATTDSNVTAFPPELINGHPFYYASYAIWATDGGTFDLDSVTVTAPWPAWGADAPPVPGDDNYDIYKDQYFYVTAFTKGETRSEYDIRQSFVINWNTPTRFDFNFKGVDLVTFYPNAFSDGADLRVSNPIGAGITPAVPEPETYAMMLAGLGITAVAARRRRQAA